MKQKNMKKTELEITLSICKWLREEGYLFYCDIAAGLKLTNYQAMLVSRMRWGRGMPDIIVFASNHKYKGFAFEVKKSKDEVFRKDGSFKKNNHIAEQLHIRAYLQTIGWKFDFVFGVEDVKRILTEQKVFAPKIFPLPQDEIRSVYDDELPF